MPTLRSLRRILAIIAPVTLSILVACPVSAATLIVTNANDNGPGSLRRLIQAANAGDTIVFAVTGTITLSSPLTIDKNLTIYGPGAPKVAISGGGNVPDLPGTDVFSVSPGVTAAMSGVTIENGGDVNSCGGAIYNAGMLTVSQTTLSHNLNNNGGAICNLGTMTVNNGIVEDNFSIGNDVDTLGQGGAIWNGGMLTLNQSTVSNNEADDINGFGGGIYNAAGGTVIMSNSTVSGNYANSDGGGICNWGTMIASNITVSGNAAFVQGGGILNEGTFTISSSLISGNEVEYYAGGGILNGGTLTLTNSTVSGNESGLYAGGIYTPGGALILNNDTIYGNGDSGIVGGLFGSPPSTVTVTNTLMANNSGGNCYGVTFNSYGHNLSDDTSCGFFGPGDQINTPPGLDPNGLQNNGGPTETIALLPTSPAVNAVPLSSCTAVDGTPISTDQRGIPRPQGSACDIGAYEYLAITALAPSSGTTCNGAYDGTFNGNIRVSAGQSCIFFNGLVKGNVQQNGGSLVLFQSHVNGHVQIQGGGAFSVGPGSTINGDLQIQRLPTGSGQNQICETNVRGDLLVQNNGTAILVGAYPPIPCIGNTVSGDLRVQSNSAATSIVGNTVVGNLQDQTNIAPTQVFNNTVSGNLQCQGDQSIQGGGNRVGGHKQGQCTGF